jgi:tRNA(fMet)-specific endonuclease VapC
VDSFLLDTSALSPLVDDEHGQHLPAIASIAALGGCPIYVSVIALAELRFGIYLHESAKGRRLRNADELISKAEQYPRLEVTTHTLHEYAKLKSALAIYYLPNVTRNFRKRWVEDWIDQFTDKRLRVDDNDLWICAQALDVNFTVIRGDKKMDVIKSAEQRLKLHLI